MNLIKNLKEKRAETVLEVTIAIFVLSVALSVFSILSFRSREISLLGIQKAEASNIALSMLSGVQSVIDTNHMIFADADCFDVVNSASGCQTRPSGRMDGYYTYHLDYVNFTPALVTVDPSYTSDAAVTERLPNNSSFNIVGQDTSTLLVGNVGSSTPTYFYGQVELRPQVDDDGSRAILAKVTVKWPVRSTVHTLTKWEVFANK